MKLGIKGNAFVVFACMATAFVSIARAQTTNYLVELREEIEVRADDEDVTRRDKAALTAAGNKLKRTGKTFSAQLGQLATAATILNKRFTNDATFETIQNNSLAAYFAEAEARFEETEQRIGTNMISRGLSNQLTKAWIALTNAANLTNGVPEKARALAKAFNKMRIPLMQVNKKFPLPDAEAPASIAPPQVIVLEETDDESTRTRFYFHTINDVREPFNHYTSDKPAEVGTWTYAKLSPRTAAIHCDVTLIEEGTVSDDHTMSLTFITDTTGTFTGRNSYGEQIQGTFYMGSE